LWVLFALLPSRPVAVPAPEPGRAVPLARLP